MKNSNIRKIIATVMVMVLMITTIVATVVPGSAAESTKTYTMTADEITAFAAGVKADGDSEAIGTEGYFNVFYSAKTKVDGSAKTFDDGVSVANRISWGGSTKIEETILNAIQIKTENAATVKIWFVCGGDGRSIGIYNASGSTVVSSSSETTKNSLYIETLSLSEAGTYYIGNVGGSNNYYKIEVTEQVAEESAPTESVYVLDATADLEAMAQGAKADGDAEKKGTEEFFTIHYSAKTKIDGSEKAFEDGYSATQRINMGGKTEIKDVIKNAIEFTTDNSSVVKVWWVSGGDGRALELFGADGAVIQSSETTCLKNSLYISTFEVADAGKYYIGSSVGSNYYFKVEVTVTKAAEPVIKDYVLDATADLEAMAQGAKADGDAEKKGTEDFFTIHYSAKTKIDGSEKAFDDGYSATQRINMGGKTEIKDVIKNAIEFTTDGSSVVKVWWVSGGDGRALELFGADGTPLQSSETTCLKNSLYISTFEVADAGKYYIGSSVGSNYYFKIQVTVSSGGAAEEPERAAWSSVAAPVITGVVDDGEGSMEVTVKALVGFDGADELHVVMYDAEGNELGSKRSIAEKDEHKLVFDPIASGEYTFKAYITRENEENKNAELAQVAAFKYPLAAPIIISATSKGNGKLEVVFTSVKEATGYEVLVNGEVKATVNTAGTVMIEGLTVGESATVSVNAVRGTEKKASDKNVTTKITEDAKQTWGFTAYGPSTSLSSNGYVGSVNEDGQVTVYSEGGKGKIQPTSQDGIAFYYTAIPTEYNFTLRATVTIDSWTISNGQEGFGLMATDRLGVSGDGSDFWNNSYLVGSTKFEYRYESNEDGEGIIYNNHTALEYASFPKYTMKLGLGVIERTGINKDNLDLFQKNDTTTIQTQFKSDSRTFESVCGEYGLEKGTYNIVGNYKGSVEGTLEDRFLMTTFILEIQKNNTGYFATYYDTEGNIVAQEKFYDPNALSMLDSENVYVGFFASRNARATFSDITLDTVLASEDKPAEERPITLVKPTVSLASPTVTTDLDYSVEIDTNVNGTLKITLNNVVIADGIPVEGLVRYKLPTTLKYGENELAVVFTPDPEQDLGEYTELETTQNQSFSTTIIANKGFYHNKVVYVSTTGTPNGNGTKEYPLDIYTAVDNAIPGQTIVIMEGTYSLKTTIKIQRGMDGTAENPIKMIADPEAKTRPVFDFNGECAGIVHGGNYWYFYGFDVTRSADMQKGFQVSGNYNTLDNIHTYYNGNTGIQISRYTGTDLYPDWPAYNLILNCTSYCNYDAGFEDADGFAAKLTIGEGNVFDGCIAYNNADDGWDLYAKVETGAIGSVTIKNCVAYANGFVPGIDGKTGNGNGFKLGGSSLSGKHVLINCYAFYNLAKGIDSNSCPDIIVENCISYNNGSYNCAFYTNVGDQTEFKASGIISFKDSDLVNHVPSGDPAKGEQLKGKGTQASGKETEIDYINATTYYWDGTACKSAAGQTLTADIFKSLVFNGISRNEDGTINMNGFLELNETAPENAGARPDGTPSSDNSTLPEGDGHEFSDEWTTLDNQYHWHECECGFRTDLGEHEYEYVIDQQPTPTSSGWKHRECKVCGKQGPKIEMYYDEIAPETPPVDDGGDEVIPPIDDTEEMNFFERIIAAIVEFFNNIVEKIKNIFA
ncbi:MAG: right-handed parallel beta-helix repeat-containing protein [Clostridia bacterium]|nr:right-handed parallel beta-helix repeat-containing protein [Clostridia bacterium]